MTTTNTTTTTIQRRPNGVTTISSSLTLILILFLCPGQQLTCSAASTLPNNSPIQQQQQQQQQQQRPTTATATNIQLNVPSNTDQRQSQAQAGADDEYLIGVGIADITGPSADINLVSVLSQLVESASRLFAASGQAEPRPVAAAAARSARGHQLPCDDSYYYASKTANLHQQHVSAAAAAAVGALAKLDNGVGRASCRLKQLIKQQQQQQQKSKRCGCKRRLPPDRDQGQGPCNSSSSSSISSTNLNLNRLLSSRAVADEQLQDRQATISLDERPLLSLAYPSWRDIQNVKLQMGYAKPNQDAGGIHLRQFCRSVIIEDKFGSRITYINLDNGMVSQLLRTRVMRRLKSDFGEHAFNESNVMLSGGFFQYMLYNIPSAGFIRETLDALVDGIARSVGRAQESMQPGRIMFARGELLDASVNRSPTSYANNPQVERARYAHDTDKEMWLLRLQDLQGRALAMMNWFAVHGTSMNNSNHLISSDNKGYAALLMEAEFNPPGTQPGKGSFVAIFAQANEGDVSPNTRGPRCIDSGLPCDDASSTCGNPPRNEKCIAQGPGRDMFESTKIIAYKQYLKARQLFLDLAKLKPVRGPVRYVHEHIDITKQKVPAYDSLIELSNRRQQQQQQAQLLQASRMRRRQSDNVSKQQQQQQQQLQVTQTSAQNATYETCVAALGYSFAAGTTDGPGAFDFQQGDTLSTRYWNMVRDFLRRPSEAQIKCHQPKPVLLSTGEMDFPYMWHPKVVPTQLFMIGQVAIVALPGEFTTMSGRRVRAAVKQVLEQNQALAANNLDFSSYPLTQDLDLDLDEDEHEDDDESHEAEVAPSSGTDLNIEEARHQANKQHPQQQQQQQRSNLRKLRQLQRQQKQIQTHQQQQQQHLKPEIEVILSGLSNIYTSYITTLEEYEMQRYEGASTLYGPHTLQAYINQFKRLASLLKPHRSGNVPVDDKLQPPDLTKSLFTLKPGVIYDGAPHGKEFGDLLQDVDTKRLYHCKEQVSASFVAGNPRNDLKQESSFLYIDRFDEHSKDLWTPVASDASWETKFIWERTNTLFGESKATIQWDIPDQCQPGVYRIRHYGAQKSLLQTINQYAGKSSTFKVASSSEMISSNNQAANINNNNNNQQQQQQLHLNVSMSNEELYLDRLQRLAEHLEASLELASQAAELQRHQHQHQLKQTSQKKSDTVDGDDGLSSKSDRVSSIFSVPIRLMSWMTRWG